MRRWEIVATAGLEGMTWIVPASEGRHYRRTRLAAWLLARRWTRRDQGERFLPFRWHVRRAAS